MFICHIHSEHGLEMHKKYTARQYVTFLVVELPSHRVVVFVTQSYCLFCRDRLLPQWLPLLVECPVIQQMYEDIALLRDRTTVNALIGVLETLHEFPITLEASLIKCIDL